MSSNQLAAQTSPYLLQHKDNPVNWRVWGPEALADAMAQNKPILLSIGYSACHWCHVMNRESFSDAETAAYMNEHFINIKVDREERPDIDLIYQTAANALGATAGWPLTAFLTPRGECFYTGTYFPKDQTANLPAFKKILGEVTRIWTQTPSLVQSTVARVQDSYNALWRRDLRGSLDIPTFDKAALTVAHSYDIFYGGMIGAPKFPTVGLTEVLLRAYLRTAAAPFYQLVVTTLDSMSMGGIYDHAGGGFFRYAMDQHWFVPHYEKMLYDNALIIDLLTQAWQLNRSPLYRERVEETIGWALREMRVKDGFASSLDAESEGEEGKYYLWTEAELDAALAGTFSQKFKETYGIRPQGAIYGKYILHRLAPAVPYPLPEADEALLKKQREKLLAIRQKRVAPNRDDKIITEWNAMMAHALANAGAAFDRPEWIEAAATTFDFVLKIMSDGDRLYHVWHDGKRSQAGFADDYAHMARAAMALWQATGDRKYLERAEKLVHVLNVHFWDTQLGGYNFTPDDGDVLVTRSRLIFDQATPCANGVMIGVLAQLYFATMDNAYRERSNSIIQAFAGELLRVPNAMGAYLNGFDTVAKGLQIAIVGPRENPKTKELIKAVHGRALPMKTLMAVAPDEQFPENHPAHGKTMENGQPTAYICSVSACSPPISNPVALSQALRFPLQAAAGQA